MNARKVDEALKALKCAVCSAEKICLRTLPAADDIEEMHKREPLIY